MQQMVLHHLAFHFPLSPGRNGNTPSLSLSYNSGSGKGIFGIGWGVDYLSIQRRTDKKLPEYKDDKDSDIFVFSGAEDLIPELTEDAGGNWNKVSNNGITRYRPRIEGGFVRIEKINKMAMFIGVPARKTMSFLYLAKVIQQGYLIRQIVIMFLNGVSSTAMMTKEILLNITYINRKIKIKLVRFFLKRIG